MSQSETAGKKGPAQCGMLVCNGWWLHRRRAANTPILPGTSLRVDQETKSDHILTGARTG